MQESCENWNSFLVHCKVCTLTLRLVAWYLSYKFLRLSHYYSKECNLEFLLSAVYYFFIRQYFFSVKLSMVRMDLKLQQYILCMPRQLVSVVSICISESSCWTEQTVDQLKAVWKSNMRIDHRRAQVGSPSSIQAYGRSIWFSLLLLYTLSMLFANERKLTWKYNEELAHNIKFLSTIFTS